jgi:alkylhydroperoxidase family enzyme
MKLATNSRISEFFSSAALFGAIFIALGLSNARAAELVMFEQAGCAWCEAFDREIAPIYGKTEEGLRAPLRRVDTAQPLPPDLAFIERERLTPLFVLVDRGREIGRIRGYPGDDHFWGLLGALMKKLDAAATGEEHAQLFDKALRAND